MHVFDGMSQHERMNERDEDDAGSDCCWLPVFHLDDDKRSEGDEDATHRGRGRHVVGGIPRGSGRQVCRLIGVWQGGLQRGSYIIYRRFTQRSSASNNHIHILGYMQITQTQVILQLLYT